MPPCPALLKKTTTRHEATIEAADLREVLGLPADAEVTPVLSTDGKGLFTLRCVWSSVAAPVAAPVPPPARGKGAPVAVAKTPPPVAQPAGDAASVDEDVP